MQQIDTWLCWRRFATDTKHDSWSVVDIMRKYIHIFNVGKKRKKKMIESVQYKLPLTKAHNWSSGCAIVQIFLHGINTYITYVHMCSYNTCYILACTDAKLLKCINANLSEVPLSQTAGCLSLVPFYANKRWSVILCLSLEIKPPIWHTDIAILHCLQVFFPFKICVVAKLMHN